MLFASDKKVTGVPGIDHCMTDTGYPVVCSCISCLTARLTRGNFYTILCDFRKTKNRLNVAFKRFFASAEQIRTAGLILANESRGRVFLLPWLLRPFWPKSSRTFSLACCPIRGSRPTAGCRDGPLIAPVTLRSPCVPAGIPTAQIFHPARPFPKFRGTAPRSPAFRECRSRGQLCPPWWWQDPGPPPRP